MYKLVCWIFALVLLASCSSHEDVVNTPSFGSVAVVSWPQGGPTDIMHNAVKDQLVDLLNEPIHSQYIIGESGANAYKACATEVENGNIFCFGNLSSVNRFSEAGVLDYTQEDFHLFPVWEVPTAIIVRESSKYKTIEHLFAAMRSGAVTVANISPRSTSDQAITLLNKVSPELQIESVKPKRPGGVGIAIGLLDGEFDVAIGQLSSYYGYVSSGEMRALAVFDAEPLHALYGSIPGISIGKIPPLSNIVGMFVKKEGMDAGRLQKLQKAWKSLDVNISASKVGTIPLTDVDVSSDVADEISLMAWIYGES